MANCEDDRGVIAALGSALAGSSRPLIVTSATGMVNASGRATTEDDAAASSKVAPRAASEEAASDVAGKGGNVSVVRLPQVHDTRRQGLVTFAIAIAREKGFCAYVGDGQNRWPAAHVLDTARLYRLALERAERGATYHAVAEQGVRLRDIAQVLGQRLKLPVKSIAPEDAETSFGWLAAFIGRDAPASSELTRTRLQWQPKERGLLADLAELQVG